MKKVLLLFWLLLIVLPSAVFAKEYDPTLKNPDFVIPRSQWGADEGLRYTKNHKTRKARVSENKWEKDFREKHKDEMMVAKIVPKDPETGEYLYWPLTYSKKEKLLVVHHSATDLPVGREIEALKAIYYWHAVKNNWGDIGYNYVIDDKGNVYEGRAGGPFVVGGHVSWHNTGSIGILLIGNFDSDVPTAPGLLALRKLLLALSDMYGIDLTGRVDFRDSVNIPTVVGHGEIDATNCPGKNFMNFIRYYRENEDFASDLVASSDISLLSGKDYFQVPAGSNLSLDYLGLQTPKRVVTIQNGQISVDNFDGNINYPYSDGLIILSYNDSGKRGDQKLIEVRNGDYGLDFEGSSPLNIYVKPGEKKRFSLNVVNNFYNNFVWHGWKDLDREKYSVFESFLGEGGSINWLSGRTLDTGENREVTFEIVAPKKEGIYENSFVYDIGGGNVLGGEELKIRLKVGEKVGALTNIIYKIVPEKIEKSIILNKGLNIFDSDLDFEPKMPDALFRKVIQTKQLGILGKAIPDGIRAFLITGEKNKIRFVISSNISLGDYEFFAILDAKEGVFESKSIKVKLKVDSPNPFLELLNEGIINVKSENESKVSLKNSGNIDFEKGQVKIYSSKVKICYKDPVRKLVGENENQIKAGDTYDIKLNLGPVNNVDFAYICLEVLKYDLYPGLRKAVIHPFAVTSKNEEVKKVVDTKKVEEPQIKILLKALSDVGNVVVIRANRFDIVDEGFSRDVRDVDTVIASISNGQFIASTVNGTYLKVSKITAYGNASGVKVINWFRNHEWDTKGQYPDNEFRGAVELTLENGKFQLVNVLNLEDYLSGLGEVMATDHIEKMKALVVVARSYAYYYSEGEDKKFPGKDYDGSDDPSEFQRYLGKGVEERLKKFVDAVDATRGEVLMWKGEVIKAPYFNSDLGKTLSAKDVWGWSLDEYPYLDSKDDPWCNGQKLNGHGVGMSGCGAQGQALEGKNYKEILEYYYPGVEVKKIYD